MTLISQLGLTEDGHTDMFQKGVVADVVKAANVGAFGKSFNRREFRRQLGFPIIDGDHMCEEKVVYWSHLTFSLSSHLRQNQGVIKYMATFWDLLRDRVEQNESHHKLVSFPITKVGMMELLLDEVGGLENIEITLQGMFMFLEGTGEGVCYVSFLRSVDSRGYCMVTASRINQVLWLSATLVSDESFHWLSSQVNEKNCKVIMPDAARHMLLQSQN